MKFLVLTVCLFFLNVVNADSYPVPPYFYSCGMTKSGKIYSIDRNLKKTETIDYDSDFVPKFDYIITDEKRVNFRELNLNSRIKCLYRIDSEYLRQDIMNIKPPVKQFEKKKFFSNICPELKGEVKYISNMPVSDGDERLPTVIDTDDGRTKIVEPKISDLGYLWQKGECSLESENLFKEIDAKGAISKQKIINGKFSLLKEGTDYNIFYANPGLIIKTKKPFFCFNYETCNQQIIYKKQLKSAIYDIDGQLHTDEDIEDRSVCDVKYLPDMVNAFEKQFTYLLCKVGL